MAKKKNFEEQSNLFLHGKRPTWSTELQIRLWVRCGGYCTMCNSYLLNHEYLGDKGKFGELAHIIAHSPNGPRPNVNDYAQSYIDSEDNIMILCPTCHTMIDKKENEGKYNEELLRKWKDKHERKIKAQTKPTHSNCRRAITFCAPIGSQPINISADQIREALFPDYFVGNQYPAEILINISGTERDSEYWKLVERELRTQFKNEVVPCLKNNEKLAVFGIAPIPLLILFGHLLSDFNVTNIQNLFRNSDNQWAWPSKSKVKSDDYFSMTRPSKAVEPGQKKILALSLTSSVRDRLDENEAIWEITPSEGPGYESIQSPNQLATFGKTVLHVLDEISKQPGDEIHVYSAIPNSAAIMFGTKFMKKANNSLYLYDYISSTGQDVLAIKISNL